MRTYIELRHDSLVLNWRVLTDDDAHTPDAIAAKARELTYDGMIAGDTISVYESEKTVAELKLPRRRN